MLPPEELILKDETLKVTIALSKTSVDFFKNEAKKHNRQNRRANGFLYKMARYAGRQLDKPEADVL